MEEQAEFEIRKEPQTATAAGLGLSDAAVSAATGDAAAPMALRPISSALITTLLRLWLDDPARTPADVQHALDVVLELTAAPST